MKKNRLPGFATGIRHKSLTAVIALNTLVFMLMLLLAALARFGTGRADLAALLGLPSGIADIARHAWTPVTYMFTHTNGLHFIFNMLWLWCFGLLMNDRRFLLFYLGGGLLGAASFAAASTLLPVSGILIGASAAVMSLTAAAGILHPDVPLRLFLIGNVRLKWVALVSVIIAFAGFDGGNTGGQWAHAGGLLFGLTASLIIRFDVAARLSSSFAKRFGKTNAATGNRTAGSFAASLRVRTKAHGIADKFAGGVDKSLSDEEALDILLDKIRLSGFDSLTQKERARLDLLSRRLNRP